MTSHPPEGAKQRVSGRAVLRWIALGAAGALAAFVPCCGDVTVVEVSPDTFEHRRSDFHEVPMLGLRLTPRRSSVWRTPVADYLEREGYLGRPPAAPRWSFVRRIAWDVRGMRGSAHGLCLSLGCCSRAGDRPWVEWSRANPVLARELWPIVVRAVQREDWLEACTALDAARLAKSVEDLRARLAQAR